jgi:hypothetical protein
LSEQQFNLSNTHTIEVYLGALALLLATCGFVGFEHQIRLLMDEVKLPVKGAFIEIEDVCASQRFQVFKDDVLFVKVQLEFGLVSLLVIEAHDNCAHNVLQPHTD